mgnify:CR=1 FL=1
MLQFLRIRDYALIEDIEVEFHDGFNVLTGETGAGKSIIVGALNLVLGARASSEAVRTGATKARIEASFRITAASQKLANLLREHDIETEDGVLLLARVVSAEGGSRAYAGGQTVPLAVLAAIGDELVDLHGQHEHQSLLNNDTQLSLLDSFAGCDQMRQTVANLVGELREIERELAAHEGDERERERRADFLRHEIGEIDRAGLASGEEEELRARRNVVANAEKIVAAASLAHGALYENDAGDSALERVSQALQALEDLAAIDQRFAGMVNDLNAVMDQIGAVADEVREFTSLGEYDPSELDSLNSRLTTIRDLARKYGATVDDILAYRERSAAELAAYENRDARLEALNKDRGRLQSQAGEAASKLSSERAKAARKLNKAITTALQDLGMAGALFVAGIEPCGLNRNGADRVSFLLAANPGEQPKPLQQVASGGEISRVMLAIKSVFAESDAIPTLIFDEIDAGVGGAVANRVAEKLHALSAHRQVLCITHLAQIAARAGTHFHVSKDAGNGRVRTHVARLDANARVSEVARLLDGSVTGVSIEHAKSLLASRNNA